MLVIRLARVGRKHRPEYRIVVQEKTQSPVKKHIAILGYYHPLSKTFECDVEGVKKYIGYGAHPSSTVARLLVKTYQMEEVKKYIKPIINKRKKKNQEEEEPAAEAPAEAPAKQPAADEKPTENAEAKEEKAETPAETPPAEEKKPEPEKPEEPKPAEEAKSESAS